MRYIFRNVKYSIALFTAFISTAYILSELTKVFQKKQVVGLVYKESTIRDFIMTGVGEERFLLKGKEIIDKKSIIKMLNIEFEYRREASPIFLRSKYANVYVDEKIVELKDELLIKIGNVSIETPSLNIFLDKKVATNREKVTVKSDERVFTTGKNLYIDIENNILKLENVKTVIRGS